MGFQQGLSGLNAASKNLDVIGHNIANSNTTGFKASRADFAEMVASAIGSASGQSSGIGVNVAACPSSSGRAPSFDGQQPGHRHQRQRLFRRQAKRRQHRLRARQLRLDKEGNLKTVDNDNVMGYVVDPSTGKIQRGLCR
jgi:flagellar hook protein FlgE